MRLRLGAVCCGARRRGQAHSQRALLDRPEARVRGVPAGGSCHLRSWDAAAHRRWRGPRPLRALPPGSDPYALLQLPRGSGRAEVRAAYIRRIKLLHPDVNQGADTTEEAAALNLAYETILQALERGEGGRPGEAGEEDRFDVFDRPEAPPTEVFINPFACYNVSPLLWEQLQQAVAGAADPEAALSQAGVAFDSGVAVVYLSPQQLRLVVEELERMSAAMDTISIEVAAFFLRDCLLRARVANNRWAAASAAAV